MMTPESRLPSTPEDPSSTDRHTIGRETAIRQGIAALSHKMEELSRIMAPTLEKEAGDPRSVETKPDGTLVTHWDPYMEMESREAFEESFASFAQTLGPIAFLGEEHDQKSPVEPETISQAELVAICDGVDGTRNFVLNRTWFGSALGVVEAAPEGFIPRFGSVLDPKASKLYLTNADNTGVVVYDTKSGSTTPFTFSPKDLSNELKIALYPWQEKLLKPHFPEFDMLERKNTNASVGDILNVLNGVTDAAVSTGCWWDVAAAFALAEAAGFKLYHLPSGKEKTSFSLADFQPGRNGKRWSLNDNYLVCHPSRSEDLLKIFQR